MVLISIDDGAVALNYTACPFLSVQWKALYLFTPLQIRCAVADSRSTSELYHFANHMYMF